MAALAAYGISADLPSRFEGRIFRRATNGGSRAHPVAQFATFPLPSDAGDFGGTATPTMGPEDIFAVLFEYGPESAGSALFAARGIPASLASDQFQPIMLRRGVAGQSGTQWFFTENGRPFTFYAVLGSHARRVALVPQVNALLAGIRIAASEAG